MVELAQGDIFETAQREGCDLIVLFGSLGFSILGTTLRFEAIPRWPELAGISRLRDREWKEFSPGRWAVFFQRRSHGGLTDDELEAALQEVFARARELGLKRIIMNGIYEGQLPAEGRDEWVARRGALMVELCERFAGEDVSVKLISLDGDFVRLSGR